jgi:hypothetical protein
MIAPAALPPLVSYHEFRSGYTFAEVRELLALEQARERERGGYMFVTRATVMGRWCQLKREAYARYRREWFQESERLLAARGRRPARLTVADNGERAGEVLPIGADPAGVAR